VGFDWLDAKLPLDERVQAFVADLAGAGMNESRSPSVSSTR